MNCIENVAHVRCERGSVRNFSYWSNPTKVDNSSLKEKKKKRSTRLKTLLIDVQGRTRTKTRLSFHTRD